MLTAVDARVVAGVANRHMVALEQGPLEKLDSCGGKEVDQSGDVPPTGERRDADLHGRPWPLSRQRLHQAACGAR